MGHLSTANDTAMSLLTRFRELFLLLLVICGFNVWSTQVEASEAVSSTVRLQLRGKHRFQFAGYYAAIEKGFYREVGLDVQLVESGPENKAIDEVLAGHAAYGVAGSELLLARLQGHPLVALAAIFQHSPTVLLARSDSGIRTLNDLVGKRVMLSGGNHYADVSIMLRREGIPLESITILPSSYRIDDLISGKVDALSAYSTSAPFILEQHGVDFVRIHPGSSDAGYYGDTLFTTEREIQENPERVKAMCEASLRGWYYVLERPGEIIDLMLKEYPLQVNREHLHFEADAMRSLILPDLVRIGHMNPSRWQAMLDTLKSAGLVSSDASLNGFIYDFDPSTLEERLSRVVMYMAVLIALALFIVFLMLKTQKRLRREISLRRQIEEQLLNANALLQRTGRMAKVGGFERDIQRNATIFGEEAARIRETVPGKRIPFEEVLAYYPPEERPAVIAESERAIREGMPWEHESLLTMPSGKQAWVYVKGEPVFRMGKVVKLVGTVQDITDRKLAELALMSRTRELEMHNSILRHVHQGMSLPEVLNSLASQAELLHPGMLCSISLYDAADRSLHYVAMPSLPSQFVRTIDKMLRNKEICPCTLAMNRGKRVIVEDLRGDTVSSDIYGEYTTKAGFLSCWSQPIKGREQRVIGVFDIYQRIVSHPTEEDIQLLENCANLAALVIEHCQAEEKIRNLAFFDVLTQLPNRRMLFDRLRQAMANSQRSGCYGALMFVDLDNFKPLNDQYGHHAGDLLLIQVTERIIHCVRETDTVARFGGDEFVVMLSELVETWRDSETQAHNVAEKIRASLAEPFVMTLEKEGESSFSLEYRCSASIGVTLFFGHDMAQEDILKCADEAMYQAKAGGRNTIRFYS